MPPIGRTVNIRRSKGSSSVTTDVVHASIPTETCLGAGSKPIRTVHIPSRDQGTMREVPQPTNRRLSRALSVNVR